ncbi:hypothetical protein EJ08DRAFT_33354 [Tothia fuscella]|uniref:F-box domain-containing protein n=1 Tax=Tothia fuscella TaxID=1048955 RepID=A0A9P4NFW2_9PEZI|nr:hypothetical protein EJ08DRAFT_33354 [Tothia fuscella]
MPKGFLDLPAEIRIKIYNFCFYLGKMTKVHLAERRSLSSQLLRTCSQVYAEGLPILYGTNKFDFHFPDAWIREQLEYKEARALSPLKMMKHLVFENAQRRLREFPILRHRLSGLVDICINSRPHMRLELMEEASDWMEARSSARVLATIATSSYKPNQRMSVDEFKASVLGAILVGASIKEVRVY